MAIAFDSVGTGENTNSANGTFLVTQTINSNSNGILIAVFSEQIQGTIVASPQFQSNNLTRVISGTESNNTLNVELWYLLNPPTGLGTLKGTWSANNNRKITTSLAFTGVSQTAPIAGSVAGSFFNASSGSVTRAISANNWFAGGISLNIRPGTTNIGNERGTVATDFGGEGMGADSTGGTLRWTGPSSSSYVCLAVELALATSTGGRISTLGLMGAG